MAAANSFAVATQGWLDERKPYITAGSWEKTKARFEKDVFPWLGKRPISEIDAPEILSVLKRIDSRGARFTAHKVRSEISRVFRYGIKEGYCKDDPAGNLVKAIPPAQTIHFASITEPEKVGAMLRAFDSFAGTFPVLCTQVGSDAVCASGGATQGRVGTNRSGQGGMAVPRYEDSDGASGTFGDSGGSDSSGALCVDRWRSLRFSRRALRATADE